MADALDRVLACVEARRGDAVELLQELVRINSVNSAYDDGPGEREAATWIRRFFELRGIEVREQEVFPNRPNILVRLPGRDPSRRVVLEAHMDTVSVQGMTIPPFEPTIADGKLYGRGSCDTKAGLAAMMHAVASIQADGIQPPCEILLAAVQGIMNPPRLAELGLTPKAGFDAIITVILEGALSPQGRSNR